MSWPLNRTISSMELLQDKYYKEPTRPLKQRHCNIWLWLSLTMTPAMCIILISVAVYFHLRPARADVGTSREDILFYRSFISALATNVIVAWNALSMLPVHIVVSQIHAAEWRHLLSRGTIFSTANRMSSMDFNIFEKIKVLFTRQATSRYVIATIIALLGFFSTILAPGAFTLAVAPLLVANDVAVGSIGSLASANPGEIAVYVELVGKFSDRLPQALSGRQYIAPSNRKVFVPSYIIHDPVGQATYDSDALTINYTCEHVKPQLFDSAVSETFYVGPVVPPGTSISTTTLSYEKENSVTPQDVVQDSTNSGTSYWVVHFGQNITATDQDMAQTTVSNDSIGFIACNPNYRVFRDTVNYNAQFALEDSPQLDKPLVGNMNASNVHTLLAGMYESFPQLTAENQVGLVNTSQILAEIFFYNGSHLRSFDNIASALTTYGNTALDAALSSPDFPVIQAPGTVMTTALGTVSSLPQMILLGVTYAMILILGAALYFFKHQGDESLTVANVVKLVDNATIQSLSDIKDEQVQKSLTAKIVDRDGKAAINIREGL